MTERFPDIEIYLLKAERDHVKAWLENALGEAVHALTEHHWQCRYEGRTMDVFFNPNAEKNFTSLWFKQNYTPWLTDLECGRAAHAALNIEVRCTDSSWQEDENDDVEGGWVKIIRGEEKPFDWI